MVATRKLKRMLELQGERRELAREMMGNEERVGIDRKA